MRRIFSDNHLEEDITNNGYVVVRSFISEDVCNSLFKFITEQTNPDSRSFNISNWNNDSLYRIRVFEMVTQTLQTPLNKFLYHFRPVMGVFTIKKPAENSDMLLHQDWSLVNEASFRSVSVWVALCDTTHANGNLQVVRKSHIYAGFPRGMNIPVPFEDIRHYLYAHALTDIPMKRGDAVVFDHRVIHASPKNFTDQLRVAAVVALVPEEAELVHYYKELDNEHELEMLRMDDRDFLLIDFFDMPNKPKHVTEIGKIPFTFRQLTIDEVVKAEI